MASRASRQQAAAMVDFLGLGESPWPPSTPTLPMKESWLLGSKKLFFFCCCANGTSWGEGVVCV